MIQTIKRYLSVILCLLLGGCGLWLCTLKSFDERIDKLPDYDYLEEIRGLEAKGRLAEAEHLADWVLERGSITNREEVAAARETINRKRTSFWGRARRIVSGFVNGDGTSIEEVGGAIVSDFFLWGDIRDLAKQGYYKATGKETDAVIAGLASVGLLTSVASYIPEPGEAAEVSADASLSLLKTFRKTGNLSKRFCGVLVDGCKKSVKSKSLTKGMGDIIGGMKGLFDGAGAARAAAIIKHVDDVDSLKAVSKMSKQAAEPTAILVRTHGAAGVDAIRELSRAEDGAESLAKAARKGPTGLKKLLVYSKYGARLAKIGHKWTPGWLPKVICALLVTFGLLRLKAWRILRVFRRGRMTKKEYCR